MDAIRIIHHDEGQHGWSFESPDLPGLIGGAGTLVESQKLAEEAVRFHLACEAGERDEQAAAMPPLEHFAPIAA